LLIFSKNLLKFQNDSAKLAEKKQVVAEKKQVVAEKSISNKTNNKRTDYRSKPKTCQQVYPTN
jgi:hypothetical protein